MGKIKTNRQNAIEYYNRLTKIGNKTKKQGELIKSSSYKNVNIRIYRYKIYKDNKESNKLGLNPMIKIKTAVINSITLKLLETGTITGSSDSLK